MKKIGIVFEIAMFVVVVIVNSFAIFFAIRIHSRNIQNESNIKTFPKQCSEAALGMDKVFLRAFDFDSSVSSLQYATAGIPIQHEKGEVYVQYDGMTVRTIQIKKNRYPFTKDIFQASYFQELLTKSIIPEMKKRGYNLLKAEPVTNRINIVGDGFWGDYFQFTKGNELFEVEIQLWNNQLSEKHFVVNYNCAPNISKQKQFYLSLLTYPEYKNSKYQGALIGSSGKSVDGVYFVGGTSLGGGGGNLSYFFQKKGQWIKLLTTQTSPPPCSLFTKNKVGKGLDCFNERGITTKVSY